VAVIRQLWRGGYQDHHGRYDTVENARLSTLPPQPPAIMVAASGPRSAELAGRIGDGLVATSANRKVVEKFSAAGGEGKPRYSEAAAKTVTEDALAEDVPCGPDPERHLEAIREYADAGFDHVFVHQIGPDQEGFMRFYEREILPRLDRAQKAA
jgi:alkanesulfonate monooxygenase SsuD/methylene tetrahydromethanopterin reductase-like flavin-dependent oxidoreductase (luciferase family)